MTTEIGAYDAKTKLPELLRRAEQGESFTITNRGRAVAKIVPIEDESRIMDTISEIQELKSEYLTEKALNSLKNVGRK